MDTVKDHVDADGYKRKRVSQACQPCKQRKRKCDGEFPCAECRRTGHNCNYAEEQRKTSRISSISSIVNRSKYLDDGHAASPASSSKYSSAQKETKDGIVDRKRSRYVGGDSSIALTSTFVHALNGGDVRIHAYGWHLGLRKEAQNAPERLSSPLILLIPDYRRLESLLFVFLSVVNSFFGLIDEDTLMRDAQQAYLHNIAIFDEEVEVVTAAAAALGSFFTGSQMDISADLEASLIERVNAILDSPAAKRLPRKGFIRALGLLTLYYRATTRPHLAWVTSCQALLLSEAVGLHQKGIQSSHEPFDRRTFLILESLNRILATDYGRSAVSLRNITVEPYTTDRAEVGGIDTYARQFCGVVDTLGEDDTTNQFEILARAASQQKDAHMLLPLLIADVCFCLYRRRRLLGHSFSKNEERLVTDIGRRAISAATRLIALRQPWWYLTNTTLQFICILIAMDAPEGLQDLDNALHCLQSVQETFDTKMTREAFNTARQIVNGHLDKQRQELTRAFNALDKLTNSISNRYEELPVAQTTTSSTPVDTQLGMINGEGAVELWQSLLGYNFDAPFL